MRNFKLKLSIFALITVVSCTKEQICKAIFLADMVCSKLAMAVPTVQTGAAFAITTVVKNIAASTNYCETESAPTSNTQYNVDYRADENTPWQPTQFDTGGTFVFDVYVPTGSLTPNDSTGFDPQFRMSVPGQYRFAGLADGKTAVNERDETNNGGQSAGTLNGRLSLPPNVIIVTVVPSADYVPHNLAPGELPKVEFLGSKKLW